MLCSNAKWILSQASISQDEINLAEKLNDEFVGKFHLLYGEVHCTINIHQASHMAALVRKWGPQWVWSMSDFEDGMGYYKRINHGPNKIDIEIANTMKMHNARYILKDLLNKRTQRLRVEIVEKVVGKQRSHQLNPGELEALLNSSLYHDGILDNHEAKIYSKAKRGKEEFTSSIYKRD
ncbi:hypothetical protein QAD02_005701 [Eretmocerus hayati]|uniref:Uncharacterized protein n=1 Tax=Eretmocerus hayati TaxID=131215 RepID=A0ACC2NT70_9HYME|nr:hypothetical protein QAD02_005701 [Eretmocerus hayati]